MSTASPDRLVVTAEERVFIRAWTLREVALQAPATVYDCLWCPEDSDELARAAVKRLHHLTAILLLVGPANPDERGDLPVPARMVPVLAGVVQDLALCEEDRTTDVAAVCDHLAVKLHRAEIDQFGADR